MRPTIYRALAISLTGLLLVGCNRTTPSAATQLQPAVEKERLKPQTAQSDPKAADPDRRAAEWVLRVDGSVRAVVDGVPHEIKKGEKLPDGPVKLLAIDLGGAGCPKATDDGRDYLRGLHGLKEFYINDGSNIRNLDFLAGMTGLLVLNSEGMTPLITDKDLDSINDMKNLKTLVIVSQAGKNSNLTDKVFAVVKNLPHLETLRLCNCAITDEGVRQLAGHGSLRSVDFWQSSIGDGGLASLATLPKLEHVYATSTKVTENGAKAFRAKAPKCEVVFK